MYAVVGDIHGSNLDILEYILRNNRNVILLGDLVDRGNTEEAIRLVLRFSSNIHTFIIGNHDFKLVKSFLSWKEGKVDVQPDVDPSLLEEFHSFLLEKGKWWYTDGNLFFVHAAFHPLMLYLHPDVEFRNRTAKKNRLVQKALFGEKAGFHPNGLPIRTYGWTDLIPSGLHVFIGHDYLYDRVRVERTYRGGYVHFVDTGSGKGGRLSCVYVSPSPLNWKVYEELVIMVGPVAAGKSTYCRTLASQGYEVVSSDNIREELFGDFRCNDDNDLVFNILHRRVADLLERGRKVAVDATNVGKYDRLSVALLTTPVSPVRYVVVDRPLEDKLRDRGWRSEELVRRYHDRFRNALPDILAGDGLSNVSVNDLRRL